jgi:hypothetical protein
MTQLPSQQVKNDLNYGIQWAMNLDDNKHPGQV